MFGIAGRSWSAFGHLEFAGGQDLLDRGYEAAHRLLVAKHVPTGVTYRRGGGTRALLRDLESDRDDGLELEDVCDIEDERARLTGVNEPQCRRIPGGENGGFRDPLETGCGGADTPVYRIALRPVRWVVLPSVPLDPVLLREALILFAHPSALNALKLFDAST